VIPKESKVPADVVVMVEGGQVTELTK